MSSCKHAEELGIEDSKCLACWYEDEIIRLKRELAEARDFLRVAQKYLDSIVTGDLEWERWARVISNAPRGGDGDCANCGGSGYLTYNPNLNPNHNPGCAAMKCSRCDGTGKENAPRGGEVKP